MKHISKHRRHQRFLESCRYLTRGQFTTERADWELSAKTDAEFNAEQRELEDEDNRRDDDDGDDTDASGRDRDLTGRFQPATASALSPLSPDPNLGMGDQEE